jgi:hypothetical protein
MTNFGFLFFEKFHSILNTSMWNRMDIICVKIILFWVHSLIGNVYDGMGITNGSIDGRPGDIQYMIHQHNLFYKKMSSWLRIHALQFVGTREY